jgi:hypothetical protein
MLAIGKEVCDLAKAPSTIPTGVNMMENGATI